MQFLDKIIRAFAPRELSRTRIVFALGVAATTDAAQFALGPLGWVFVDQMLDVMAMVLTSAAIGFHMLLLPTFVIEVLPLTDMLPTWTACTAAVVMLRRRQQNPPVPPPLPTKMAKVTPSPGENQASVQGQ
ncbi:MAG TPA: hypothetical protein VHI52_07000 [Verrucomicrobiae bacterium]|nr:hypothetical protein [Verrucomicrobiae bacterium]